MSEKKITPEELAKIQGGKRTTQTGHGLQDPRGDVSGPRVVIQDVEPLGDPIDPRP